MRGKIAFVSMCGGPWGGSEELWSRTALDLVGKGFKVTASVMGWSPPHSRVLNLHERGVRVRYRRRRHPLWRRAWQRLTCPGRDLATQDVETLIAAESPDLVVFSDGGPFPAIEFLELCASRQLPFVTIGHANSELHWIDDDRAERYRTALALARKCYFVSTANLRLAEKQVGCDLLNAQVVWNPVNLDSDDPPAWPPLGRDGEVRLACVGRLEPAAKGQDLLIEALAKPAWVDRRWRLNLYGEGPMQKCLERLVQRVGLTDRVVFAGSASVREIWAGNHALVMPSRYEGLPLAMVEAMLCGRPIIATDVAGHSEIVEDGVTGFLADAATVKSVAIALERFWNRRVDARDMGAAGSKRIRELRPTDPVRVFSDEIEKHVGRS